MVLIAVVVGFGQSACEGEPVTHWHWLQLRLID